MAGAATFGPDDDGLHTAVMSDRWWETETAWFSFHVPERRLGGWLYTMVRPNIGTVAGGVWVWDDAAWLPWDVPYSVNLTATALPPDLDLRHAELPTGVTIDVVEPTSVYDLGYVDGDRLELRLRFAGVMAPEPLQAVGSTFGSAHHFDQLGRVTGELVLHGERIAVDCIAMRDRTWGPRPGDPTAPGRLRHRPPPAPTTASSPSPTARADGSDPIAYGFLRRDGETVGLAGGVADGGARRRAGLDPHGRRRGRRHRRAGAAGGRRRPSAG